jgi:hypothetical protein
MLFNKNIHNLQNNVFIFITYLTWILYLLIALGLSVNAPQYLNDLQYYVKIYVSLFLLLRFNPFRNVKFTELDKKIAFTSGLFILATTAINEILINYVNTIRSNLDFLKIY